MVYESFNTYTYFIYKQVLWMWMWIFYVLQERRKEKDTEKDKKRKRRKTDTDSEDEEKEEFQIFCVEERLTVAHRPNYQGSSTTSGTLYPALVRLPYKENLKEKLIQFRISSLVKTWLFQVFKALVDKPDLFKTKKLPVEFLSDHKLVFQEYSHLKTVSVSIYQPIQQGKGYRIRN